MEEKESGIFHKMNSLGLLSIPSLEVIAVKISPPPPGRCLLKNHFGRPACAGMNWEDPGVPAYSFYLFSDVFRRLWFWNKSEPDSALTGRSKRPPIFPGESCSHSLMTIFLIRFWSFLEALRASLRLSDVDLEEACVIYLSAPKCLLMLFWNRSPQFSALCCGYPRTVEGRCM